MGGGDNIYYYDDLGDTEHNVTTNVVLKRTLINFMKM